MHRLTCFLLLATLLLGTTARGQQGESWALPVCADPDNLPYSSRAGEGFELEIARIVADELGARLEMIWLPLPRREGSEELMLRMGFCDVLLSVPDGREPFLTTLAYYRSSEMFVFPEDAPFEVDSLDDPDLAGLRIGVQRGGPGDFALTARGLIESVDHFHPTDPAGAIVRAVADGSLDVGIVWGPIAGYHAQRTRSPVVLEPVTPQIGSGFVSMVHATSMAVRAQDSALREMLDQAIASRWREIEEVLASWNVPTVPLPEPIPGESYPSDRLTVGVVLPALSGVDPLLPLGPELAAEPARQGAVLAEEHLGGGRVGPFRLRLATAPTAESAERAARRLVLADGATALIGGVGEGQAAALERVGRELEALFVNIGTPDQTLREGDCSPLTFHLEASDEMYLQAIVQQLTAAGLARPYVVHGADERGEALADLFGVASRSAGGTVVASESVPVDQPLFLRTFANIEESGADSVVLLLPAGQQLVFLGQYESMGGSAVVHGFPEPQTQTRQFYAALAQDAPEAGTGRRVALWEANLPGEAGALGQDYLARWGRPMDPPAWAGYAAVELLVDAYESGGSARPADLAAELLAPERDLDLGKEGDLTFDPATRQLQQPLYVVRLDARASRLADLASPVSTFEPEVPSDTGSCPAPRSNR